MAYWDFEDLPSRTSSDEIFCNKNALLIMLIIQNMMNTNVDFLRWFIKSFDKKSNAGAAPYQNKSAIQSETSLNQQAEELHKTINRKCKKRKLHFSFTLYQWNHGCRIIIHKCIQHITKENMLLLKDLL